MLAETPEEIEKELSEVDEQDNPYTGQPHGEPATDRERGQREAFAKLYGTPPDQQGGDPSQTPEPPSDQPGDDPSQTPQPPIEGGQGSEPQPENDGSG
mgnify:CR=1 FL=1